MARQLRVDDLAGKRGHDLAGRTGEAAHQAHLPAVSTGNPRVTVASPFSKIEIREPAEALR
jgi:hypothetical protein